jgi:hypothetical protein
MCLYISCKSHLGSFKDCVMQLSTRLLLVKDEMNQPQRSHDRVVFNIEEKTRDFFYYSVYKGFDTQNGCRPILARRACRSFLWRSRHGFIVITFFSQRIYLNDLSVRGKRPEKPRTKNFGYLFFLFFR